MARIRVINTIGRNMHSIEQRYLNFGSQDELKISVLTITVNDEVKKNENTIGAIILAITGTEFP
jgi:hypothetical protein